MHHKCIRLCSSENAILTGLAETRDGVLFFGEGITELSNHAKARGTGGFRHSAHARHTTEKGSEVCFDFGGLGSGLTAGFWVFHVFIIHIRGAMSRKFRVFLRLFWEPIPSGWPSLRSRTGSHDPRCCGAVNGGQVPLIVLVSHFDAVVVSLLIRGPDGAVRINSVHDHLTEVETEETADFGGVVFLVFHTWIVSKG